MLSRLLTAAAVAALALPATARAAPVVVAGTPDGAKLTVEDQPNAVRQAQLAPATVDRIGYTTPYAFCLQALPPGGRPAGGCDPESLPTTDDPVVYTEAQTPDGEWVGGAVPASAASVRLQFRRAPAVLVHVFGAGSGATLVLADGRRRTAGRLVRVPVPPAAAQCGYAAAVVG